MGEQVDLYYASPVGNNIRYAGEDVRKGDKVLTKGTLIRPQEIGMLSSVGCQTVPVIRRPKVAILATGDELVDVDEPLGPGKIRNTNSYSNAAQVLKHGGEPVLLGIARDDEAELAAVAAACAEGLVTGIFDARRGPYPEVTMGVAWDRARREAMLRMKEMAGNATVIVNVRIETSTIGRKANKKGVGCLEAIAYGTALIMDQ